MVAYHTEWRHGDGREKFRDKQAKYRARYPDRQRARDIVQRAVANGHLMRGPCEFADAATCRGAIEAHHDDYTKPLEVRWVCRRHHRALDRARRQGEPPRSAA